MSAFFFFFLHQTNGILSGTTSRDVRLVAYNASDCWRPGVQYINLSSDSYLPADASELPAGSNNSFVIGLGDDKISEPSVFNLTNSDKTSTQPKDGGYSFLTGDQSSLSVRMGNEFLSNEDLPGTIDRVAKSMTDYIHVNSDLKGVSGTMDV